MAIAFVADYVSSFTPLLPGIPFLWVTFMFYPCFVLWFKSWGLLALWLEGGITGPFFGQPYPWSFVASFSSALFVLSPILFKASKTDISLKRWRDVAVAIVVNMGIIAALQTVYYNLALVPLGWYTLDWALSWTGFLTTYAVGLPMIAFHLLLLRTLSPYIKRSPLYVKGWI